MPDAILTVPEAAKLLKVSDKTVYTWTHIEGFPAVKIGSITRIPYDLLMDWMNAQAVQNGPGREAGA